MADLEDRLDRLLDPATNTLLPAGRKPKSGDWTAGIEWNGTEGTITTAARPLPRVDHDSVDWDDVLREWNLDPEIYAVVEPVLFNVWDANLGNGEIERMRQVKGRVVLRRRIDGGPDVARLLAEIRRTRPRKAPPTGDGVFSVVLADWQIGKADGDGLRGTIERVYASIEAVKVRVRELRRQGRSIGTLNILWPGDSVEGCVGFYADQEYAIELDRREQAKVVRRLLLDAIKAWAPLFTEIRVVAVGGNHGENRRGKGDAFTGHRDNDDLAVIEQVSDILAENPEAYGHVRFLIPEDALIATVETAGWTLGLTHGHVARESGTAEAKLRRWYERMAGGKQAVGEADILVTGHYHHLRVADWGGCVWLQAPALDGGSEWWQFSKGEVSDPGTLTFASYPDRRMADLAVL